MDARVISRAVRNPYAAGALLFAALLVLSLINDTRGTLGTDTGIKVGTYRTMDAQGTHTPVIGWWAAEWDPTASQHPFRDTRLVDGHYIDVTTLPMALAAYPLWQVGGYRLALLWPMAGAVACAFIARAFARRLGAPADGWAAFWLTGLASPLVIYGLDLWEHTLGVAFMAGGILLLYDALDRSPWWRGLAAGAAFGLAFTMRTEALVYAATSFAIIGIVLLVRRRWVPATAVGVGGIAGFGALVVANVALETTVIGATIRSGRASGTAAAGGSGLVLRLREGVVTLFSAFPSFEPIYLVVGVLGSLALVGLAHWGTRTATRSLARMCAVAVVVVLLARLSSGLGFFPGLLATTPFAAVGLALGWRDDRRRLVLLLGLVPVPFVVYFQFVGGALPQWGGRYLLSSGLLVAAVGVACLPALERWAQASFVGLAVGVTVLGLAWMSVRTHEVGVASEHIDRRPEAVLIFPDGFVAREFAAVYGEHRWLAPNPPGELGPAIDIIERSGQTSFAVVSYDVEAEADSVPGFHVTGRSTIPFLDPTSFVITSYARDGT